MLVLIKNATCTARDRSAFRARGAGRHWKQIGGTLHTSSVSALCHPHPLPSVINPALFLPSCLGLQDLWCLRPPFPRAATADNVFLPFLPSPSTLDSARSSEAGCKKQAESAP